MKLTSNYTKKSVSFDGGMNYRVIQHIGLGTVYYTFHEAYYDKCDMSVPHTINIDPVTIWCESISELGNKLCELKDALNRPILSYDAF